MVKRVIDACLDHPRRVLCCVVVVTGFWGAVLPRLRLETDGRVLFSPHDPSLAVQRQVDQIYGASDFTVVGVSEQGSDSIFTPEALNWILHFTKGVQQLDGVLPDQVRSLATVPLVSISDGEPRLSVPLTADVQTAEEAQAIRTATERNTIFRGTMVSLRGSAAAVYVPIKSGANRESVYHQIEALAAAQAQAWDQNRYHLTTYILGPAAAESLLGEHILSDLAVILPCSIALVGLLLWAWFRQAPIVVIGLAEVAAMQVWSLGLMSLMHKPLSLVTVVMPVILAVFCVADTIHIAQRFNEKCRIMTGLPRRAAMISALGEVLKPVVFASLTALAGFLSFALSPIPPVRDLGIYTAFGIACDLVVSLLVIPPMLLASTFGSGGSRRAFYLPAERLLARLTLAAADRPLFTLFVVAAAALLLGAGTSAIAVQDSWIDNFNPKSELAAANDWFNKNFYGSDVLNVLIDCRKEGGVFDPDFLLNTGRLEVELGMSSGGGGVIGPVTELRALARAMHIPDAVPASVDDAQRLYRRYVAARAGLSSGAPDPFVSPDGSEVNLWVFINHANYGKTASIISYVQYLPGLSGEHIRYAGNAYRGYLLVDSISRNLRTSLLASLAMTFALVALMLRSIKSACLAMLPVSLAVLCNFGIMGWMGIPLGVATSTFSAIALGMGVDFALHWMARFRLAIDAGAGGHPDPRQALQTTGSRTGGAILLNAAVLIVGFGILMLSGVPPNRRLGLLMCVNLFVCAITSLVLMPAFAGLRAEGAKGRLQYEPEV